MNPSPALPELLRLKSEDGTRAVLLASRCRDCGAASPGTRAACPNCTSPNLEVIECEGEGKLVTYTVVHRAALAWTGRVPYALGEVELPERIVVTAEVVDPPPGSLKRGAPMRLALERIEPGAGQPPLVIHRWRVAA